MKLEILNRAVVIGAIVWLLVMVPVGFLALMLLMFPAFATGSIDMGAHWRNLSLIALGALCLSIVISGVAARASANRIIGSETLASHSNTWSRLGFYVASGALVSFLGPFFLWMLRLYISLSALPRMPDPSSGILDWLGILLELLIVTCVPALTGALGGLIAFLFSRKPSELSLPRVSE